MVEPLRSQYADCRKTLQNHGDSLMGRTKEYAIAAARIAAAPTRPYQRNTARMKGLHGPMNMPAPQTTTCTTPPRTRSASDDGAKRCLRSDFGCARRTTDCSPIG